MTELENPLATARRQVAAAQATKRASAWNTVKNGEYASFCKEQDSQANRAIAQIQADAAKAIEGIKADALARKQAKETELQEQAYSSVDKKFLSILDGLDALISLAQADDEGGTT